MEDPVSTVVVGIRSPNYANHGKILTVSSGDGVEDAETTDGEGDDAGANTLSTSVAVGGVAGVKLVAAADDVELRLADEVVEES